MKTKKYTHAKSPVLWQAFQILLVMIALANLTSCSDFTEVDLPQTQLTGSTVFDNVGTAKAALADVYARLREQSMVSGTQGGGTCLLANYSDDMDWYGTNTNLEQFNKHTIIPSNTTLTALWNTSYGEIYALNAIIEGVQASTTITGEDRDRLLGEALFLRGFIHFYHVNMFGAVPYVTTTDYEVNTVIAKTPEADAWQKIIADLSQAESLLPESYPIEERVRPNKAVVQAMLARVYLYTANYDQAEAYATAVIDNGAYSIEPNPDLAFLKESPAIIWSFHPGLAGQNTKDARAWFFSSGPPIKSALSENLYNSFEPGDLRKTSWIKNVTNGTGTWHHAYKYKKNNATDSSEEYTILLRIEEQYLIRAEARAMTGDILGAQTDLNMTRNRAGLSNTLADTPETLKAAILNERRFEFFCEQGHRWFDLKRTGTAADALSAIKPGWQATDVLFPLPETELLLNPNLLPQNPGY